MKFIIFLLFIFGFSAHAVEFFEGKVTSLEPSYLPTTVAFHMDAGNTTCPVGTQLKWSKADQENNKAVYSTLLSAMISGKKVRFYINTGDTACNGQYLHLLAD